MANFLATHYALRRSVITSYSIHYTKLYDYTDYLLLVEMASLLLLAAIVGALILAKRKID